MVMLLSGFPVAFVLASAGLAFFAIGTWLSGLAPEDITLAWPLLQAQPDRIFGIISNDVLLAIPFFTLMGLVFQKSGIAEELLSVVARLFGRIRGGLCYAVILVGALLAATTGVVSASVMTMGLIALPIMMRSGYHHHLAAGTISAAGTLSQIVPPSLVLIVMADQVMVPVGDIYRAALMPSVLMIGAYLLAILVISLLFPSMLPHSTEDPPGRQDYKGIGLLLLAGVAGGVATHVWLASMDHAPRLVLSCAAGGLTALAAAWLDGLRARVALVEGAAGARDAGILIAGTHAGLTSDFARRATYSVVPTLGLIFLVLGTIFLGIATPTESGALGAAGALLLVWLRGRLNKGDLQVCVLSTAKLTVFVFFILIGARMFSLTFYGLGGDEWLHGLLTQLPGGRMGFIFFSMVAIFVLGCFLDFFEIAFIVVPLLLPVAHALEIDPLWFAILVSINLQTSFLTPPFGFALFYLRSVAPDGSGNDRLSMSNQAIYYGAIPFIAINLVVIAFIAGYPETVMRPQATFEPGAESEVDFGLGNSGDFGSPASNGNTNLNDLFK
ncbi:TRAP transporter large permease [Chelativorans alearense]|uniref:TRAP transporter large permease n=1 Tax=Chelativorans alearense TaxID=2681495 RepID=UPI001969A955|nr:TRAP transporter large permease subunit [Chelativorans alearense]